ncbi:MAG: hypothetical protein A2583_04740 [Bdellovibrionales bacterium RIFOXYD1_FULL_53_11]|nr:MAG: hypothetical protein A2583_04740 [Bdellovibrionales bacterium RIFOXYD1_FULL_53_11]
MIEEALILAGGLGTRLRGVVNNVPKPMAAVEGRPFLEHLLDYWIARGVHRFVLSVCHLHQIISGHFGSRYRECEIRYVVEKEPLGTGGAIIESSKSIDSPRFLVLNGDTFFEISTDDLCAFHHENKAGISIALRRLKSNSRFSPVVCNDRGLVTGFLPQGTPCEPCYINAGVYIFEKNAIQANAVWPAPPLSFENDMMPEIIKRGVVFGKAYDNRFLDIGVPEDYHAAAAFFRPC